MQVQQSPRARSLLHGLALAVGLMLAGAGGQQLSAQGVVSGDEADSVTAAAAELSTATITYQGTLTNTAGKPVHANVPMTFRIYRSAVGGTAVWTEARTGANAVPVINGLFSLTLGALVPIPLEVWSGSSLYLSVQAGADPEMTPREALGTVPVAGVAAAGADGFAVAGTLGGDLRLPADRTSALRWGSDAALGRAAANGEFSVDSEIGDIVIRPADGKRLILSAGQASGNYPAALILRADGSIKYRFTPTGSRTVLAYADSPTDFAEISLEASAGDLTELQLTVGDDATDRIYLGASKARPVGGENPGGVTVYANGNLEVDGAVIQGALVERNLLSGDERKSLAVARFKRGDLLCWNVDEGRLDLCRARASVLVQAVAGDSGLPVVLGAEPVCVTGIVEPGDLLVSGSALGCAEVWRGAERPPAGAVIAQALEASPGGKRTILAMIRKF